MSSSFLGIGPPGGNGGLGPGPGIGGPGGNGGLGPGVVQVETAVLVLVLALVVQVEMVALVLGLALVALVEI